LCVQFYCLVSVNHVLFLRTNKWNGMEWKVETRVIPIVVGALGTMTKSLEKNLKKAGSNVMVELLQKAALIGTSRILRRVLDSD